MFQGVFRATVKFSDLFRRQFVVVFSEFIQDLLDEFAPFVFR